MFLKKFLEFNIFFAIYLLHEEITSENCAKIQKKFVKKSRNSTKNTKYCKKTTKFCGQKEFLSKSDWVFCKNVIISKKTPR